MAGSQPILDSKDDILSGLGTGNQQKAGPRKASSKQAEPKVLTSDEDILAGLSSPKKKDTGSPGASQSPSSGDINGATQNWQSGNLSGQDVNTLAQTDFGRSKNLDKLHPDQHDDYANVHNNGTKGDLIGRVQDMTKKYADILYNVNPGGTVTGALNESITKATQKTRQDLIGRVAAGDTEAIAQFRKMVTQNLQSQIDQIHGAGRQGFTGGPVRQPVQNVAFANQPTAADIRTQDLQDQIKAVNETMDQYTDELMVQTARKMPGGISNPDNAIEIGKQKRRLNGVNDNSFSRQQNITDKNAITYQNYEDRAAGMDAIIDSEKRSFADAYKAGVESGDPNWQVPLKEQAKKLSALINMRGNLPTEYLPVQVSQVARLLGEKISSDNKLFNLWISKGDISKATGEIEAETPGFKTKYAPAIAYIMQHNDVVPKQGLYGAVERGLTEGAVGLEKTVKDLVGSRGESDRAADEIKDRWESYGLGTTQSGAAPTKIVLDPDGNVLIEKKNENYSKFNFNTSMNHIGNFAGNMVVYGGLTEGVGGLMEGTAGVTGDALTSAAKATRIAKPIGRWGGIVGSTYLMSYDQNLDRAEQLVKGNDEKADFKKGLAANLMTLGQSAAMSILPANELVKEGFMKELSNKTLDYLAKFGEDGLTKEGLTKFMDEVVKPAAMQRVKAFGAAVGETAQHVGKANAEMLLINHANNIVESIFDDNGVVKRSETFDKDLNTVRDATLGTLFFSGLRLAKAPFNMTARDALYDAASNADENIARIRKMANDGDMDQDHANGLIKVINTAKEAMPSVLKQSTTDGHDMTIGQRKKILAETVRKSILEDGKKTDPENSQIAGQIKTADENIKAQQDYVPYNKLDEHYILGELGLKSFSDVDPEKEYTFTVSRKPEGIRDEHIKEEETTEGKKYTVTAKGSDLLEYLKNPDTYETARDVRAGGRTDATPGQVPEAQEAAERETKEAEGSEAPPLVDGHEAEVLTSQSKTSQNGEEQNTNQGPGQSNREGRQGTPQEENDNQGRGPGASEGQGSLAEGAAQEARPEAAPFSESAAETKENHQDAIRMIERKNDRITSYNLDHPESVGRDVLRNIAAKEKEKAPLTDAEKRISEARRQDIDDIKVNDEEKRFPDRQSESDKKNLTNLDRKVRLIDKFGVDDIVKRLTEAKEIKKICE